MDKQSKIILCRHSGSIDELLKNLYFLKKLWKFKRYKKIPYFLVKNKKNKWSLWSTIFYICWKNGNGQQVRVVTVGRIFCPFRKNGQKRRVVTVGRIFCRPRIFCPFLKNGQKRRVVTKSPYFLSILFFWRRIFCLLFCFGSEKSKN